jgi:predicted nucleotidyltransferase
MILDALISDHLPELAAIAARHGVRSIRLFGSRARGTATESSDVDLLVEPDRGRGLLDLVGFKQELEQSLGRPVDVVTERGLSPYLRDRILAEARTIEIRAA